jgi:hypothetical protein
VQELSVASAQVSDRQSSTVTQRVYELRRVPYLSGLCDQIISRDAVRPKHPKPSTGAPVTKILPTIGRVVWFTPSRLTPVVASVAREYMGLGRLPHLDIRIGDVRQLVHTLSKEAPYDFVVEDVFFDGRGIDKVDEYVAALARLVAPSGWLVRGDRDLPSSLNRTRSPTLKFAKLKGPRYFFAFSPKSRSRRWLRGG